MAALPAYTRLIHSDWSTSPQKRWSVAAIRDKSGWRAEAPGRVGDTELFLDYLREDSYSTLAGFDFPIGLPESYGQKIRLADFCSALDAFGSGPWSNFYDVAEVAERFQYFGRFTHNALLRSRVKRTLSKLMAAIQSMSFVGNVRRPRYRGAQLAHCFGPLVAIRSARQRSRGGRRSSAPHAALERSSGPLKAH